MFWARSLNGSFANITRKSSLNSTRIRQRNISNYCPQFGIKKLFKTAIKSNYNNRFSLRFVPRFNFQTTQIIKRNFSQSIQQKDNEDINKTVPEYYLNFTESAKSINASIQARNFNEAINQTVTEIEPILKLWKQIGTPSTADEYKLRIEILEFLYQSYYLFPHTQQKLAILLQYLILMHSNYIKQLDGSNPLVIKLYAKKYEYQQALFTHYQFSNQQDKSNIVFNSLEKEFQSFPPLDDNNENDDFNPIFSVCKFRTNVCKWRIEQEKGDYKFDQSIIEDDILKDIPNSLQVEGLVEIGDILQSKGFDYESALIYYKLAQKAFFATIVPNTLPQPDPSVTFNVINDGNNINNNINNNNDNNDNNKEIADPNEFPDIFGIREFINAQTGSNEWIDTSKFLQENAKTNLIEEKKGIKVEYNRIMKSEESIFPSIMDLILDEKVAATVKSVQDRITEPSPAEMEEYNPVIDLYDKFQDDSIIEYKNDYHLSLTLKYLMCVIHSPEYFIKNLELNLNLKGELFDIVESPGNSVYDAEALEVLAVHLLIEKNPYSLFCFSQSLIYLSLRPINPIYRSMIEKRIKTRMLIALALMPDHPHWKEAEIIETLKDFSISFQGKGKEMIKPFSFGDHQRDVSSFCSKKDDYFSLIDKLSTESKKVLFSVFPTPFMPAI